MKKDMGGKLIAVGGTLVGVISVVATFLFVFAVAAAQVGLVYAAFHFIRKYW